MYERNSINFNQSSYESLNVHNNQLSTEIKRGEIWLVDLPQTEQSSSIQYGKRPALILSTDINNKFSPIVNIIPLTSKLRKVYPMHVLIPTSCGLNKPSFAMPEQITSVMKERLIHKIGECDEYTMRKVEQGIKLQQGMRSVIDYNYLIEKMTLLKDLIEQIQSGFNVDFNIKMKACFEKDLVSYCYEHDLNYNKLISGVKISNKIDYRELRMLIG